MFNQFPNECVSRENTNFPDWNAIAPTDYSYGYGYGYGYACDDPTPGYVAQKLDVTVNTTSYKHDIVDDTMEIESINSKGKVKVKKLCNGFDIVYDVENYGAAGEIVYSAVIYNTKTFSGVAIIPGSDYVNGKYAKHFENIVRYPGCSKAELNDLIGLKIKTAPCKKQRLFPHQGINVIKDGRLEFAYNSGFVEEIEGFMSPDVIKRKKLASFSDEEAVKRSWAAIFGKHPVLCFLSIYYLLSLLKFFLESAGIIVKEFLCIMPSDKPCGLTKEKLIPMLSTDNFHRFPLPRLESGGEAMEKAHSGVYDGVLLIEDTAFADEEDVIIDGVKGVIRCTRNAGRAGGGRNVPMILSKSAGYTAAKLAPDNVVIIDTEGVELNYTVEEIERVTDLMTALVYQAALSNHMLTKEFFVQKANYFRQLMSVNKPDENIDALIAMLIIENFLESFLGMNYFSEDSLCNYKKIINNKGRMIISANTAVKKEFSAKLSEKFREKSFSAVKKVRNFRVDDDGKTGVISGDRLWISSAMIDTIVKDMNSVRSSESIINAFKADGDLIITDGYTHPFDSHDSNGDYQRLYFYDFPADILDDDILYHLQNPEDAAFMLTEKECRIPGFMPLISVKSGEIVGKRFFYSESENENIALYGQSGEGKSYTKSQIMANRFANEFDIVVFDTSDSDTYDALCDNLSKEYVDKNVVFHKLDDGELNIDIFKIDRSVQLPSQKKELLGIITAGVGDLTGPQTNTLRSVISDLLAVTDVDKPISPDDLLALLDEEGPTYESLLNRFEPFIEDVKEYGLTSGTWKDFFSGERKIHVIQINEGYSGNGNQIVDTLLATLYNYKRENPQRPLSVFIDEVQNQNFSVSSPIRKILKEGRKHHLSIVAATQDYYARKDMYSALGKAGMQIFHRPTQDSVNLVAAELHWNKADIARFDSMERGDVIIKGALFNKELGRNSQTKIIGHIISFLDFENIIN